MLQKDYKPSPEKEDCHFALKQRIDQMDAAIDPRVYDLDEA
jgi:hypothetical protein